MAVAIFLLSCLAVLVVGGMILGKLFPDTGRDRPYGIEEDSAGTDSGG